MRDSMCPPANGRIIGFEARLMKRGSYCSRTAIRESAAKNNKRCQPLRRAPGQIERQISESALDAVT
jgi:hypothetical protein